MKVLPPLMSALLIVLVHVLSPFAFTANADGGTYAYANEKNTAYICSEADETCALFAVPESYCVRILYEENGWCYVSYAEDSGLYQTVKGYCKAECLTIISEPPVNTYLYMPVTVTYSASSGNLPALDDITVTAAYYGNYNMGSAYYSYVLYNGSFGYIKGSIDEYPVNEYAADTFTETEAETESGSALAVTVAIIAIAAAAVLILYFTGRKPTPPK